MTRPAPQGTRGATVPRPRAPVPAARSRRSPFAAARAALRTAVARVTGSVLGARQTAAVRIGVAGTWGFYLLREWPHRAELYGPGSPWGWDLAQRLVSGNGAFTALLWSRSEAWFTCVYVLALLVSFLLVLGWRTRTMSVLFALTLLSLQNRSVFVGDGGDNLLHLLALYLCLTRCGQVWSLDARRRALGRPDRAGPWLWVLLGAALLAARLSDRLTAGWTLALAATWAALGAWWLLARRPLGETRALADILGNLLHHAGLLLLMAQTCLVYAAAGWYKIQGSRWQDGTAVYYPLELDSFSPWPALSHALAAHGILITLLTYGTVFAQVAFPFSLLNRRAKNVLIIVLVAEHLGIAFLLGLPFFSLAMLAADAVFLPTGFLRAVERGAHRLTRRLTRRPRRRTVPDGSRRTARSTDHEAPVRPGTGSVGAAP
ncbi:HTTM domain-containing protein [Streptomyces sp. NRRL F-5630]|uniref:HTTM domain-containing protein n=1 Tax=unclassified Streptomyces TaxID=2593676 RepID=UPI0004CBAE9E|nr:HTTM domain-containing protein [Streptomyces sp. NRRL F-5630]